MKYWLFKQTVVDAAYDLSQIGKPYKPTTFGEWAANYLEAFRSCFEGPGGSHGIRNTTH